MWIQEPSHRGKRKALRAEETKGKGIHLEEREGKWWAHCREREREVTLGKEMCEEGTGMLKRECLCAESSFMRVLSVL